MSLAARRRELHLVHVYNLLRRCTIGAQTSHWSEAELSKMREYRDYTVPTYFIKFRNHAASGKVHGLSPEQDLGVSRLEQKKYVQLLHLA